MKPRLYAIALFAACRWLAEHPEFTANPQFLMAEVEEWLWGCGDDVMARESGVHAAQIVARRRVTIENLIEPEDLQ